MYPLDQLSGVTDPPWPLSKWFKSVALLFTLFKAVLFIKVFKKLTLGTAKHQVVLCFGSLIR